MHHIRTLFKEINADGVMFNKIEVIPFHILYHSELCIFKAK